MSGEIKIWPHPHQGRPLPKPKKLLRPCDYGLTRAIIHLESQLGTIEAYNRLVEFSDKLRDRIEKGDIKAQNPLYAKDIRGSHD